MRTRGGREEAHEVISSSGGKAEGGPAKAGDKKSSRFIAAFTKMIMQSLGYGWRDKFQACGKTDTGGITRVRTRQRL